MIRLWILWLQTLQGGILPALFYSSVCRAHGTWDLARRWESLGAPAYKEIPIILLGAWPWTSQFLSHSELCTGNGCHSQVSHLL